MNNDYFTIHKCYNYIQPMFEQNLFTKHIKMPKRQAWVESSVKRGGRVQALQVRLN